jgi:antibiotic biosynthesis monooxygenase (ABM) superfamily enzyme
MPHPLPSANRCQAPPRHKLALLTFVGLVAPVYFIPPVLSAVLPWGRVAVVLGSLALIVPLMTYAIMPALMWLFGRYSAKAALFADHRSRSPD